MPIYNSGGGAAGITIEVDPTALKITQNLNDLADTATARSNLGLGSYLQLAGGTMTGAISVPQIHNNLNTDLVVDAYNDTGAGTHYTHIFTNADGRFLLATNGGGLTFPDGTTQTTATLTGPAGTNGTNGTNGTSGAMNYMDLLAVTATNALLYVNGNVCYTYFAFLNANQGWLFNKLNANGVRFTAYVNGNIDNDVIGAFNGNIALGTFTTTPTAGDVIEVYISDPVTDVESSFLFATAIYY